MQGRTMQNKWAEYLNKFSNFIWKLFK